ncbi:MAG: GDSL family lipase [Ruminococcaceae bacterium]|nr:GDSL family lipase [Oscillospiraceae bacterium]
MKILFQGDSITDAGRDRSNILNLGHGYANFAAKFISDRHPDADFTFWNLGISGNRAECLRDRWQTDCIDLQPDLVSIMIGINDTWHHSTAEDWMPNDYFEDCYRFCLEEIKSKTNAKIILLEQYLVPTGTLSNGRFDVDAKLQITRKLAREYGDWLIPTDGLMAAACVQMPPEHWAADGVHPTAAGAELIAYHYADAFDALYPDLK